MKLSGNLHIVLIGGILLIATGATLFLVMRSDIQPEGESVNFSEVKLSGIDVRFLGWVVEYNQYSASDFEDHVEAFTWVSPTGMFVDEGMRLQGAPAEGVSQTARQRGVLVLPLVANRNFDAQIAHRILTDEAARGSVISQLVAFVEQGGYDGINIDFEGVPESDRNALTEFMRMLASVLRPKGKLVTIDVPAKTYDATTGWAGAFDYRALGEACDLVIIMAYDYHWSGGSPGPISPLGWFEDVVKYAVETIPRDRLMIGIPFYGYDWPAGGGGGRGVSFGQALQTAAETRSVVSFDNTSGEYTFAYMSGGRREVWFQGAKSTELRLQIVRKHGLTQVAAWCIGQEDPRTWEVIRKG